MHLLPILLACTGTSGPPAVDDGEAISLRAVPPASVELAPKNRSKEPPEAMRLEAWSQGRKVRSGAVRWTHDLPIRPRALFFHRAKPGMAVQRNGEPVPFGSGGRDKAGWGYSAEQLHLNLPEGEEPGEVDFFYPKATERERRLHRFTTPDLTDAAFMDHQVQDGWTSRSGLLLPAPSTVAWSIEVPPAGEFHFVPTLVEPEQLDGPVSDGALVAVDVTAGDDTVTVYSEPVRHHDTPYRRVDLSKWAGQTVTLTVRSEPRGTSHADHVFLAEPVVASRKGNPRTVLMVFIDTLRPDHMGLFGYERDTTAALTHLDGTAAIFQNARSIAPWTLPSARTIVTGMQPEAYSEAVTLQETLRDEGWATAFIAGNVYLSANFDMHRGWDYHSVGMWPLAEVTTDEALGWLDERQGRDVLLQVHYMGVHLPYKEPVAYRHMFAGDGPEGMPDEFHLPTLREARLKDEADRQYIRDRYDNNVRYVTDQVQRLVSRLDDNDILLLYSDHGEEFWDHGGLEHGHTTYDELLRVPVVVKAPGVKPGRIDTPISLLDLAPTVLDLVDLEPAQPLDGSSLVPLANGDAAALEAFSARHHGFGRPLYGLERWGVIADGKKWSTHEGKEMLFDLGKDPAEKKNLLRKNPDDKGAPYRAALAETLHEPVDVSFRLQPTRHRRGGVPDDGLEAICTVAGGFRHAWAGDDPLDNADVEIVTPPIDQALDLASSLGPNQAHPRPEGDDASWGAVHVRWRRGGAREVYLTPELPFAEATKSLHCTAHYCPDGQCAAKAISVPEPRQGPVGANRGPFAKATWAPHRDLELTVAMAPYDPINISGRDDETNTALEALGYKDPDADDEEP